MQSTAHTSMAPKEVSHTFVGIGKFSLSSSTIEGHIVRITTGKATFEFPLREDVSTFRAPIKVRWAKVHILDAAGRVQGEGRLSLKVMPAQQHVWRPIVITVKNAEEVGQLRCIVEMHHVQGIIRNEEIKKRRPRSVELSPYRVEASDFDNEDLPECTKQQKDMLLGETVPAIDGADNIPMEWLQEHGFKDVRDYVVQLYIGHFPI